jgi:hypothetical protein
VALAGAWLVREAIADAAADLLAQATRPPRFAAETVPAPDGAISLSVAQLLTEVSRRHAVLGQLPQGMTADTAVMRLPQLAAPAVQVSARQWALLIRMTDGVTPRGLALGTGLSVFSTTLAVYRLIAMDLAAVVGGRPVERRSISFIRATPR